MNRIAMKRSPHPKPWTSKGRSPSRRTLPALAFVVGLAVLLGCGQEFDLPPQPDPQAAIVDNTYNLAKIWEVPSPTALASWAAITYVIEEESRIRAYNSATQALTPVSYVREFQDLVRPVRIAIGGRDEHTSLYVADAGDMTIKRFPYTGGAPDLTFSDPRWQEFSGLSADDFLNVYVADATRDTVFKYTSRGEPSLLISDSGSGRGFVNSPHGLFWNGRYLLVADTGKSWAQRLFDDQTNRAAPGAAIGEDFELNAPEGISTNRGDENNVFVADTGSGRVFKFTVDGTFVDSVYTQTKIPLDVPVEEPRHISVVGNFVFLADPPNGRILGLELAGVPDSSATGQP